MAALRTGTVTFLFTDLQVSTRLWDRESDAMSAALVRHDAILRDAVAVSEPLRVRIGIHTGVAELPDGDYFGSAVNRAARLEAIAHGGQIVCSQATADLAAESLADEVELRDLGEHRLRDLSRPERVFQVTAAGLDADFPPLQSVDAFSQLPAGAGDERVAGLAAS